MVPEALKSTFKNTVRGNLNISEYDFTKAEVRLVCSVTGLFKELDIIHENGLMKFNKILKNNLLGLEENARIYFSCTSFGKIIPKVLIPFC
jgi:hypothetical protein